MKWRRCLLNSMCVAACRQANTTLTRVTKVTWRTLPSAQCRPSEFNSLGTYACTCTWPVLFIHTVPLRFLSLHTY